MKKYLLVTALAFWGIKNSHAATFTSIASGNYGIATTWNVVGIDADGIPDNNDDVIISAGNTVTLNVSSNAKTLTINPTGILSMNSKGMLVWGNLTNNGSTSGTGIWYFYAPGTYTGNGINNNGTIYFFSTYTIAAGVNILKNGAIVLAANVIVTNNGNINLVSAGLFQLNTNSKWINTSGSSLNVSATVTNNGTIDCSAASNTFTYQTNAYTTIMCTNATYYNLVIKTNTAVAKSLNNNLTVLNNLTISSLVTLNCANHNITLGGNWTNTANTTCTNMGTVTFNGAGTQTITRTSTEQFKNVTLSGAGTVLLARDVTCSGNVTITTGALDVSATNYNLNIAGNFSNAGGTLTAHAGTVTFNGAAAQTISGASTTSFYNLTSTNTVGGISVTGAIIASNILTVSSNSFGTSGAGMIIISAMGPTTFGRIAPLGAGATLTGTGWVIQSYINGPTTGGWQYLGSPTQAATLADWDVDARFWMSGTGGNDGNAYPMFYSVRTVTAPSNLTYANVTSQATALTPGKGFMVWMADNHNASPTLSSPLVFDTHGTPNQGTINKAILATGYNLMSNPYACPITYASVLASSSATLSVNFVIVNGNGSYSTNPNGGVIATSQGFLAWATGAGNMTFSEAHKSIVANPTIVRTGNPENFLRIKSSNEVNGLGGEAEVQISADAHNGLDQEYDLPFIPSPFDDATNIWTSDNDNKDLLLNVLDANSDNLDIPMSVVSGSAGKQLLSFIGLNGFSTYSCASLENIATGEIVNLKIHDTYSFAANTIGEKHDFIIHFERNGNCSLANQNITASLDASSQVFTNDGKIMVQFGFEETSDVTINVFNTLGQEVTATKNVSVGKETITLDNPGTSGIYLVRITKGNEVVTKKIFL
jgi:hypothetical protein